MKNNDALAILQHVTEVSHGHTVTADHLNSLKQWVRLEEEKAQGSVVVGVLITKNLIREVEVAREAIPLHEATDPTPVDNPTPPRVTPRRSKATQSAPETPAEPEAPVEQESPQEPQEAAEKPPVVIEGAIHANVNQESDLVGAAPAGEW